MTLATLAGQDRAGQDRAGHRVASQCCRPPRLATLLSTTVVTVRVGFRVHWMDDFHSLRLRLGTGGGDRLVLKLKHRCVDRHLQQAYYY